MYKITEQELFDYIFCPAKYHMKYIMKIDIQDPISMPKLLNKVAKYFYMNLLNGKVCSINEIKSKWDSVCMQYPHFVDSKKSINGYGLIISLLKWAGNEEIIIGDVDQNYKILMGNVEVFGTIETILVRKDRRFELLYTNFADKDPDQLEIDQKLKYTLDALAFKVMHDRAIDGIRIHSVKADRNLVTYRTDPDFERLQTTVSNVARAIDEKIFYPRESHLCNTCTARELCRYWSQK